MSCEKEQDAGGSDLHAGEAGALDLGGDERAQQVAGRLPAPLLD